MLFDRRGDIYAWVAALMVFVGIPLASLSIDIVRMMYIRGHLHTATDAACQAAVDPLDHAHFFSTGQARIDFNRGRAQARDVFQRTLTDAETVRYVESLTVDFPGPRFAHCAAVAQVRNIIPFTPGMTVRVETTSEMRVRYGN
ncbi:MAG: hypothetical protein QY332_10300 [Anaerolineales bacterium]|nr:MAG: hypothetical protein QY332_10300 [Anaerolineales bacterium]